MKHHALGLALILIFTIPKICLSVDQDFYTNLRLEFSQRENYDALWHVSSERKDIFQAIKDKNYELTASKSKVWLDKYPIDAEIHYIAALSNDNLGNLQESTYHYSNFYGLLNSLLQSGDGLSSETAIQVISTAEEYLVIQFIGGKFIEQSLIQGKCTAYDQMEIEINGEKRKMYFDVAIPLTGKPAKLDC